ncbi:MAG: dihydroorotase [Treponema sp.]|jgi:dihydroorotase|nr:dihydroorotase [Treponema sp.]
MARRILLKNFRIVDESADVLGSVFIEDGRISAVIPRSAGFAGTGAAVCIDAEALLSRGAPAGRLVLMPAFTDLHAHFRDPCRDGGPLPAETLESASLAAAAGGYGTLVCMANTKPPLDALNALAVVKARAGALGLIDLYPAMSLTAGMEGRSLSGIASLSPDAPFPRLLSEDGRDVADDGLFRRAFAEARRLGLAVSCHCDAGGPEAEAAKQAGAGRDVWSRIEENNAVRRVLDLGRQTGCRIHIAHVSTREAADMIRKAKAALREQAGQEGPAGFALTCEVTPHHLALTEETARALGDETYGRVNPPLRTEADRQALIAAVLDGTIDAIATDHAPHTEADKAKGAPGFTGLETSFAVCRTVLVREGRLNLSRLSALMSANPARILGLGESRGRIAPGFRADILIVDPEAPWTVEPGAFISRGKNSPFAGRELTGRILMTLHEGRVVYEAP